MNYGKSGVWGEQVSLQQKGMFLGSWIFWDVPYFQTPRNGFYQKSRSLR